MEAVKQMLISNLNKPSLHFLIRYMFSSYEICLQMFIGELVQFPKFTTDSVFYSGKVR